MEKGKKVDKVKQKWFEVPDMVEDFEDEIKVHNNKENIYNHLVQDIADEVTKYGFEDVSAHIVVNIGLSSLETYQIKEIKELKFREYFLNQLFRAGLITGLSFSNKLDEVNECFGVTFLEASFGFNPEDMGAVKNFYEKYLKKEQKKEKTKTIPKVIFVEEEGKVLWGDVSIPFERGQRILFKILYENRDEVGPGKSKRKGKSVSTDDIKKALRCNDKSFRNRLKSLKSKMKDKFPIKIVNESTGYYKMQIKYVRRRNL